MSYLDGSIKFREFDPLKQPSISVTNCVLHMGQFLQTGGAYVREGTSIVRNFRKMCYTLEKFHTTPVSVGPYRIDLLISINGHIEEPSYIEYLKKLDGTMINTGIFVTVFQRQNTGYQWGGFHDTFIRYRNVSDFFATIEGDCFLTDNWFDRCVNVLNSNKKLGYVGMDSKKINTINPGAYRESIIPSAVWRNGNNQVINMTENETGHTRGGFYFCKKELCERMDQIYGCFTHSMGCNHSFDGVVLGEVGFAQKTKALGYDFQRMPNLVVLSEG